MKKFKCVQCFNYQDFEGICQDCEDEMYSWYEEQDDYYNEKRKSQESQG